MAVKIAADNTGSVTLYIDGVKIFEYTNIRTAANTSPTITDIKMSGSIAQNAYDAPAHLRKFDALMLTDNWQDIVNGGYLSSGDTQAPTVPDGLLAQAISSSQINLSWTASTDNVAVTGYRVYRNGTQIDTSPTNSYSNTGLSASTTYTYSVSAYDAVNNVSVQSAFASATTAADTGGGNQNSGGSGGDASASGGSGCGFVKDDGKGQEAKGEGLALMIMLIIALAGIAIVRKMAINKGSKGVEHIKKMICLMSCSKCIWLLIMVIASTALVNTSHAAVLVDENFDDTSYTDTGWTAWLQNGNCNTGSTMTINSNAAYRGSAGLDIYYQMGDNPRGDCQLHQDNNTSLVHTFSPGLSHYFVRGYFRFPFDKTALCSTPVIQRKLIYFKPQNYNSNGWNFIVNAWPWVNCSTDGYNVSVTFRGPTGSDTLWGNGSPGFFPTNNHLYVNTWYYIEAEVEYGAYGQDTMRIWLAPAGTLPSLIFERTDLTFRSEQDVAVGITLGTMEIGRQVDIVRDSFSQGIDEHRYWDEIVISTTPIGPLDGGSSDNTPPPSSGGGGDSGGGSGGSGCGFVKDSNSNTVSKSQSVKATDIGVMLMLFLLLILFKLKKANQYKWQKKGFTKPLLFFMTAALIFLLFAEVSHAADYYVSPTGAATWPNCSGTTPLSGTSACSWQTAMANAVAGDIVYFRGGTYDLGTFTNNTGNMRDTKMYPANSGTSGQPITFIAYPGEVPNITGTVTATSQQAWFGCGGKDDAENRNYITWDGFSATMKLNTAPGETAIFRVAGDHCTIRNSNFTGVDVGNWHYNVAFVRVETATNALIENNYFRDLTSVSYSAVNTAAVYFHMLSNTTTVRNNTVENCEGGIYGKGNSANVSIYNNFIYNSANTCMLGMYYKRSVDTGELQTTRRIYQNVIVGCAAAIKFEDGGQTVTGSLIYNNTIYANNGTDDGIEIQLSHTNTEVFNNIIHGRNPYLRYYDGTVSYSNYNDFYNVLGNVWNRNYATDYTSLSAWTAATGFDVNSITSDPLFVNAGGASAADYKLQANSPAKTSGRGGSYATVMGAYIIGNETIGYDPDAPRVEITSPASSTITTTNTSITISGTASDTQGIVSVTCNNDRGGNCACTGTTNWTCSDIPLQTGQNIITVTATDGDNKTGIDAITVIVSSGSGNTGGNGGSGGDNSASGGSGCGFVKEDNGKGQGAKGEGVALMMMLFLLLFLLRIKRSYQYKWQKVGIAKTMLFFIATAFTLLLITGISNAATYYVSPTGSAAWANCSGSTPLNGTSACSWQTAMANAVADDIVYFRGGTYNVEASCSGSWEWIAMTPANSGSLGHPITFIAYPGETPVITPCTASPISPAFGARDVDYIIYDGFSGTMASGSSEVWYFLYWNSTGSIIRNSNFTGANHPYASNSSPIRIDYSTDSEVYNNVIHGNTGGVNTAGIWLFSATRVKIYNNTIYDCAHAVMQKLGPNIGNEIYNNFMYSITSDGITLNEGVSGGNGHKVYQNVFLNIGGVGISIYNTTQLQTDYQIYNNTIYGADVGIHSSDTARNAQIWNNIIVAVGSGVTYARYYTGAALPTVSDYNNFYGTGNWNLNWTTNFTSISSWTAATGFDVNSITSDPLFVNAGGASAADYKLQANSPAKTSGRGGSYATVMGAYIIGNETIGYDPDAPRVEITSPASSTITTTNTSITISTLYN